MAESIDQQLELANVYAAALFQIAQRKGTIDEVRDELAEVARLCRGDSDFAAFLASDAVDSDRRRDSLEKIFRGRLSDDVLNTLQVMNRNGRARFITVLHSAFAKRVRQTAGQIEAVVTSAVALNDEQRQRVSATAAQISGKSPLIEYRIDPEILGGLILQVGDLRYDNSVRRHLASAHTVLRDRAERGLKIGTN